MWGSLGVGGSDCDEVSEPPASIHPREFAFGTPLMNIDHTIGSGSISGPTRWAALVALAVGLGPSPAHAQTTDAPPPVEAPATPQVEPQGTLSEALGSAVVFEGDTLFFIQTPLGPFGTDDRATGVSDRLRRAVANVGAGGDSVSVVAGPTSTDVLIGQSVVTAVTDADAQAAGISRDSLVALRVGAIRTAIARQSPRAIARAITVGLAFTIITAAAFVLIVVVLARVFPALYAKIESGRGTRIPALRIQRLEILTAGQMADGLILLAKAARIAALVLLIFYLVPLVLSFFPWTAPLADTVFDWITTPLRRSWNGFVTYLPNLFTISVIVAVVYGLDRFIRLVFLGLERGAISIAGFYRDWADPTYKIVRFVVIAFGAIMIWPYLPGSGSAAFQGVSVFLGIMITFGSASAVANVVAGVVMTYMRPFLIGDRVRIADTIGDVTKRTLLVTKVRTIKNVDVTIPNSMVLSSHIINYSSSAAQRGLILHTTVTLGYDAPWRKVHEVLIGAARATEGILAEPAPFVLQTALNDHNVAYELNAYTDRPGEMAGLYSRLHQNMQDKCNEAGIEILSPLYASVRDGNQSTIPEDYLPKSYQAPGWRFFPQPPPK